MRGGPGRTKGTALNYSLVVHLKTGLQIPGELAQDFDGSQKELVIVSAEENNKLLFTLDQVCFVRFAKLPSWATLEGAAAIETVHTITGESFRVMVANSLTFLRGFFGIVEEGNEEFPVIFFTITGVRFRCEERTLGEILQDNGMVSRDQIEEALTAQNELRNRRIGEVIADVAQVPAEKVEQVIQQGTLQTEIPRNVRIGDILVDSGLVTREQVEFCFSLQQNGKKMRLGELLINQGFITEEQLLYALAAKFRLRYCDLEHLPISEQALSMIPEALINRLQVLPVDFDGRKIVIATSTPTDPMVGDSLRFSTSYNIELVVSSSGQIKAAIEKYFGGKDAVESLLASMKDEAQSVSVDEEMEEAQFIEPDSEVIALINRLLLDAYKRGASDIHIEPGMGKAPVTVRYRVDGECFLAHTIAASFRNAIVARIKIIAGLDISERRRPQSGKILLRFQSRKLEYRVEITPTVGGMEDAVLRLLAASKPLPLELMGLMPYNIDRFKTILAKPYGIILCVGPTGSGKTTTLHSALGHINTPARKIWTAEDPVEITQAGLRQVQTNPKIGFSFAEALRSFLRADPDVIMIGEMRDVETAKIAIEASLTGHLVFSTLHTNSAPETVVRLIDMGMDPFNFADALLGIVAQRLARKLCDECKQSVKPTRQEYDELMAQIVHEAGQIPEGVPKYEEARFMGKKGCEKCGGTGYKGRVAVHELLLGTPQVKKSIREEASVEELRRTALAEGMWTLRMDGIMKVLSGLTDIEQINKVCI